VDAVSLYPAGEIADVAIDPYVAAISVRHGYRRDANAPEPKDALTVVALQFPVVATSSPADGDNAVPLLVRPALHMTRSVTDVNAATVRLVQLDGSTAGVPVNATVSVVDNDITIVPATSLLASSRYRLTIDGVS